MYHITIPQPPANGRHVQQGVAWLPTVMAGNFGDTVPDDEFTLDEIAEMRRKCREFRAAVLDGIAGCEANLDRLEREITMAPLPIRVAA